MEAVFQPTSAEGGFKETMKILGGKLREVFTSCCKKERLETNLEKNEKLEDDPEKNIFLPLNNVDQSTDDPPIINEYEDYEKEDWFHPEFDSMSEAHKAMIIMSKSEGTFFVTNIPEKETSYKMYGKDGYIILQVGAKCDDVRQTIVQRDKTTGKYKIFGMEPHFSSLYELIEYFQLNPLPAFGNTLNGTLTRCKRCRKCKYDQFMA